MHYIKQACYICIMYVCKYFCTHTLQHNLPLTKTKTIAVSCMHTYVYTAFYGPTLCNSIKDELSASAVDTLGMSTCPSTWR